MENNIEIFINSTTLTLLSFINDSKSKFMTLATDVDRNLKKLKDYALIESNSVDSVWDLSIDLLSKINDEIDAFDILFKSEKEEAVKSFSEKSSELIEKFDESFTHTLSDLELDTGKYDDLKIKSWKHVKNLRKNLIKGLLIPPNVFLFLLRKDMLSAKKQSYSFNMKWAVKRFFLLEAEKTFQQNLFTINTLYILKIKELFQYIRDFIRSLVLSDVTLYEDKFLDENIREHFKSIMEDAELVFSDKFNVTDDKIPESIYTAKLEEIKADFLHRKSYYATMLFPRKSFNPESCEKLLEIYKKESSRADSSLQKIFQLEKSDWKKNFDISILQLKSVQLTLETNKIVKTKVDEKIVPSAKALIELLETVNMETFESSNEIENKSDIKKQLIAKSRKLLKELRNNSLQQLFHGVSQTDLVAISKMYLIRMREYSEKVEDSYPFCLSFEINEDNIKTVGNSIPLKQLIFEDVLVFLEKKHIALTQEIEIAQERIVRRINEVDLVISSTFDAAIEIIKESDSKSQEAIITLRDGVERTIAVVQDMVTQFISITERMRILIPDMGVEFVKKCTVFTENERAMEHKLFLLRQKAKGNLRRHIDRILKVINNFFKLSLNEIVVRRKKIRQQYHKIQQITGLAKEVDQIGFGFTQFLNKVNYKIDSLPYVYRRLFSLDSLVDASFCFGRDAEINALVHDFKLWRDGAVVSTIISGERGGGKTSVINLAEKKGFSAFPKIKIEIVGVVTSKEELLKILANAFSVPETTDLSQFMDSISDFNEKIIIVEDIHNLFLRIIDGYSAIELFLLIVSKTQRKFYWIVTCNAYAFNFLEKVFDISNYFQRTIELGNISADDIEKIIMKRHFTSAYQIKFKEPGYLKSNKKYSVISNDIEKQKFITDYYFTNLATISNGNISVALLLFLNSIDEITKDTIIFSAFIISNYKFISNLPKEDLFRLAVFVQHEKLKQSHFSKILNIEELIGENILGKMYNHGILIKNDDFYFIHPFIYRAVVKTLKSQNILH